MAATIRLPINPPQWLPDYNRNVERAINDVTTTGGSVATFTIDGGSATTTFTGVGALLVDFGGAS